MDSKFPTIQSPVFFTPNGVPYLREPGVVLLAQPLTNLEGLQPFLDGFDPDLEFAGYLQDETAIDDAAQICKTAGQTCYLSFGPKRTKNDQAGKYFDNLKSSGHGSVFEHANFTFLFYGIDRSVTHELVRHRAGFGFSQVSQRYVNGKVLRFVERPEYVDIPQLHSLFINGIERAVIEYDLRASILLEHQQNNDPKLAAEHPTDRRKRVNQAARSGLPNETEAPIVVTANARAWRHFSEMRCSPHADIQIRALAGKTLTCLRYVSPILFGDYEIQHTGDNLPFAETKYRKV